MLLLPAQGTRSQRRSYAEYLDEAGLDGLARFLRTYIEALSKAKK